MPYNLVGFTEATPGANGALAVGGDEEHYTVTQTDFLEVTPEANKILGVICTSVSTGGGVLLRQPKMIDHHIIKCAESGMSSPSCSFTPFFARNLPLRNDVLRAIIVNATDEASLVGLMLGSGKITRQMVDAVNPTHVIHGYSNTTVTAYYWSHVAITWTETLDAGKYEIVGMRCGTYIASGWVMALARLKIPGTMKWRPGVPTTRMLADYEEYQNARYEMWAEWPMMGIQFDTKHMPNIEVLCPAALTHQTIELTLVKVRED